MRLKCWKHVVFGVWLGFFYGIVGAEAAQEWDLPENDARRTEIEEWVDRLGDDDFHVRRKAEAALREAGKEAYFALVPAAEDLDDYEKAHRARQILRDQGVASPSEKKEIDRLLDGLKKVRTREEWDRVMRRLHFFRETGKREFEKIRRSPEGNVEFSFDLAGLRELSAVVGEEIPFELRLTNNGKKGVWISPLRLTLEKRMIRPVEKSVEEKAVEESEVVIPVRMDVMGNVYLKGDDTDPEEAPFVYLEPGESYVRKGTVPTTAAGKLRLTAKHAPNPLENVRVDVGSGGRGTAIKISSADKEDWPKIEPVSEVLKREKTLSVRKTQ